jgi:hypothetical protein
MSNSKDDGTGCAVIIAVVAISIGVGCLVNAGWGWITLGALFLAIVVIAGVA